MLFLLWKQIAGHCVLTSVSSRGSKLQVEAFQTLPDLAYPCTGHFHWDIYPYCLLLNVDSLYSREFVNLILSFHVNDVPAIGIFLEMEICKWGLMKSLPNYRLPINQGCHVTLPLRAHPTHVSLSSRSEKYFTSFTNESMKMSITSR